MPKVKGWFADAIKAAIVTVLYFSANANKDWNVSLVAQGFIRMPPVVTGGVNTVMTEQFHHLLAGFSMAVSFYQKFKNKIKVVTFPYRFNSFLHSKNVFPT